MVTDPSCNNKLVTPELVVRIVLQQISSDLRSYGNEKPTKT